MPLTVTITADPSTVSGTSTALEANVNESLGNLTYEWTVTQQPAGADVTLEEDEDAASITFDKAGVYTFSVLVTDTVEEDEFTATDTVEVTVTQTLEDLDVNPATAQIALGTPTQFYAVGVDQFGDAMTPSAQWSVTSGVGVVASGLYNAAQPGAAVVQAASGALTATANVTVVANAVQTMAAQLREIGMNATPLPGGESYYASFGGNPERLAAALRTGLITAVGRTSKGELVGHVKRV